MSYVECLNNRAEIDIPLMSCIWLSNEGVRALDRVFPYGIEGSWLFYGEDSDDSRMWCLKSTLGKSIFGMKKVHLI